MVLKWKSPKHMFFLLRALYLIFKVLYPTRMFCRQVEEFLDFSATPCLTRLPSQPAQFPLKFNWKPQNQHKNAELRKLKLV